MNISNVVGQVGELRQAALSQNIVNDPDLGVAMPLKVSIVEDNDRVRESLSSLIDGARGFRCAGAHRSAEAAATIRDRQASP